MVGVQVREVDGLDVGQAHGAQELALGALAAVEQQPVAAAAHQDRRAAPPRGRHRAGSTGEEQRQVHPGASVTSGQCQGVPGVHPRGNVIDLAVAVVIGAAFTAVVGSIVKGLIKPLIAAVGGESNFGGLAFTTTAAGSPTATSSTPADVPIVAAVTFFLVIRPLNHLMEQLHTEPEVESPTRECPECLSDIPVAA